MPSGAEELACDDDRSERVCLGEPETGLRRGLGATYIHSSPLLTQRLHVGRFSSHYLVEAG